MNREYLKLFMDKTGFPEEAKAALLESEEKLASAEAGDPVAGAAEFFAENDFSIGLVQPLIEEAALQAELSPYIVWLLMLIEASCPVYETWQHGEQLFWDTFTDLRYKVIECKINHGVWGNFVAFWYPIFYTGDIVKLGRLEYEDCTWPFDEPYEKNGVTLKKGDPVKSIHIPSSGEPFDAAARLDSYRRAYEFFREELHGGPLVCFCDSWLLYPAYKALLPETSNIAGFMGDFDVFGSEPTERFEDAWRVFGPEASKPAAELPERTSLQRAFKRHLVNGGSVGIGLGVLIFDGEKLIK